VGMELGIYFLLRRSEFLPCRTSGGERSRGLQWKDLKFMDIEGRVIPLLLERAESVTITITRSKTDQFGEGRVTVERISDNGKDTVLSQC
jgi:hypothetical protein